jgi:hypothetical protein
MIIRPALNFAAHFVAGVAIGMLAVSAMNNKKQAKNVSPKPEGGKTTTS